MNPITKRIITKWLTLTIVSNVASYSSQLWCVASSSKAIISFCSPNNLNPAGRMLMINVGISSKQAKTRPFLIAACFYVVQMKAQYLIFT